MSNHRDDLLKKYPELLERAFDISHPVGWATLVDNLCAEIHVLIHLTPGCTPENFYVQQIKQKFGGLRFYMTQETASMAKAIRHAEDLADKTCEVCGALGVEGNTSATPFYVQTLCAEHQR